MRSWPVPSRLRNQPNRLIEACHEKSLWCPGCDAKSPTAFGNTWRSQDMQTAWLPFCRQFGVRNPPVWRCCVIAPKLWISHFCSWLWNQRRGRLKISPRSPTCHYMGRNLRLVGQFRNTTRRIITEWFCTLRAPMPQDPSGLNRHHHLTCQKWEAGGGTHAT